MWARPRRWTASSSSATPSLRLATMGTTGTPRSRASARSRFSMALRMRTFSRSFSSRERRRWSAARDAAYAAASRELFLRHGLTDGDMNTRAPFWRHNRELIADLRYEPYFLTVYDIVAYARSQGIPLAAALRKHLERIMREFDA